MNPLSFGIQGLWVQHEWSPWVRVKVKVYVLLFGALMLSHWSLEQSGSGQDVNTVSAPLPLTVLHC